MPSIIQHTPATPQHVPTSTYNSNGFIASDVVAIEGAVVKEVRVNNASGALRYLHMFNDPTLPANGVTPSILPLPVAAGTVSAINFPEGRYFNAGIAWCSSTTLQTKTLGGSDFWVEIDFCIP